MHHYLEQFYLRYNRSPRCLELNALALWIYWLGPDPPSTYPIIHQYIHEPETITNPLSRTRFKARNLAIVYPTRRATVELTSYFITIRMPTICENSNAVVNNRVHLRCSRCNLITSGFDKTRTCNNVDTSGRRCAYILCEICDRMRGEQFGHQHILLTFI